MKQQSLCTECRQICFIASRRRRFPNFFDPLNPLIQPSLIFPVPADFISNDLPRCAIRPLTDEFAGAVATVKFFTNEGLFMGQTKEFLNTLQTLAEEADAAVRKC